VALLCPPSVHGYGIHLANIYRSMKLFGVALAFVCNFGFTLSNMLKCSMMAILVLVSGFYYKT